MAEYLYRISDGAVSDPWVDEVDMAGNQLLSSIFGNRIQLYYEKFLILKETPCGGWIDYYGTRKFVNLEYRKKFAARTKEEALIGFIARKNRQVKILSAQLNRAKYALSQGEAVAAGKVEIPDMTSNFYFTQFDEH